MFLHIFYVGYLLAQCGFGLYGIFNFTNQVLSPAQLPLVNGIFIVHAMLVCTALIGGTGALLYMHFSALRQQTARLAAAQLKP